MFPIRPALIAPVLLLASMLAKAAVPASAISVSQVSEALFSNSQSFWSEQISQLGGRYRPSKLSFFTTSLSGHCKVQAAVTGPFYCPVEETVYLDQPFLQLLDQRSRGHSELTLGYLIAHEVAHHIQNVIGTTALVEQARSRSTPQLASRTWTALELQADCYAGLWAHWSAAHGTLKLPADVSSTLDAVVAVSQAWQSHLTAGQQMLDPFTHGSAAQRLKWFRRGLDTGGFGDCDTFGADAAGTL